MDFADVMCLIGIVGFGVMVVISLSAIGASRKQKFQAREMKRIMDTYGLTEWPAEARWDSITGYKGRACYKLSGVSLDVLGEQGLLPGQLQKPAAATPQAHSRRHYKADMPAHLDGQSERELKSDLTAPDDQPPEGAMDWDIGESYGEWG